MSQPFVGEVRLVGFNFAPLDWQQCAGQLIAISQNEALFALIGTTYGGDGQNTFALPDLRGRIPIHQGSNGSNNYVIGQVGGAEQVTVTVSQYPAHSHVFQASNNSGGGVSTPANNTVGAAQKIYSTEPPLTAMNQAMIGAYNGGNQPHNNLQPFQVLNWIISMFGIFPTRS